MLNYTDSTMKTGIIRYVKRLLGWRSRLATLLRLLMLFPVLGYPCFASSLTMQDITLQIGRHDSIVKEHAPSISAVVNLESSPYSLAIGYRNRLPVHDISLYGLRTIAPNFKIVSYFHTSLGTADSILTDFIIGYEQGFTLKNLSLSYALGLQASTSFFPFLERPLFNASPYLAASIGYTCFNRCKVTIFSTTNTLFEYACQSISPILGSTCTVSISDEFEIGATYSMQLSDVSPEAVLITSKEVGVYGKFKPKK
ncbi:hypothetical protein SAMN06298221_104245 [Sphaerochaeta associata]|nr:hypothetical protein SAMN06298221_104245 [Sphaerochaeta associata]